MLGSGPRILGGGEAEGQPNRPLQVLCIEGAFLLGLRQSHTMASVFCPDSPSVEAIDQLRKEYNVEALNLPVVD